MKKRNIDIYIRIIYVCKKQICHTVFQEIFTKKKVHKIKTRKIGANKFEVRNFELNLRLPFRFFHIPKVLYISVSNLHVLSAFNDERCITNFSIHF